MDSRSRLFRATREGNLQEVGDILSADPSLSNAPGEHGKTPLHEAAEYDRDDVAARLLETGASIESTSEWGQTAFEWAATMGSARVAKLLLDQGASGLGVVTAASLGMTEEVRALIARGLDLRRDARTPHRHEPDEHWPADSAYARGDILDDAFYGACRNGHVATAELLEAYGARIDALGVFGGTGLHWAAINGHEAMVRWLLERGANATLHDRRFDADAASWAEEGGHPELAKLIRRHLDS